MKLAILSLINTIKSDVTKLYGLGYNAKHGNGACPSYEKVRNDFLTMKKVTGRIRTFGLADCMQGDMLIRAAQETGMNLSLGMWISNHSQELGLLKELVPKYKRAFQKNIETIVVGSESMYRKENSNHQVANLIRQVKTYIRSVGLVNKITTSDTKDMWYTSDVTKISDLMFVNAYPFWEGITVDQAVDHLFKKIDEVKTRTPGKRFVLGETGWPEGGKSHGAAIPGKMNQIKYFRKFVCRAQKEGLEYYWFSAFNESWKKNEEKANWGVFTSDYKVKDGYQLPIKC